MKPNIPRVCRRVAVLLPALTLLLAPLAANAREKELSELNGVNQEQMRIQELENTGRAGAIEEFNFGQPGTDITSQREDRGGEDGTRLLSGRVMGIQGRTIYVERSDRAVVPLDMSALRIKKQPKVGQQVIAEYQVNETQNVCVSLLGEVAPQSAE
jgi:hypothetical protein